MKPLLNTFRRVCLVEPNLIRSFGHVVEFSYSLTNFFKQMGVSFFLVGNREAQSDVEQILPNLVRLVSLSCFQDLHDNGNSFFKNLSEINEEFALGNEDLVLVLTSYVNEIIGTGRFMREANEQNVPRICLWFHQIYPPTDDFSQTLNIDFRNKIHGDLNLAFKALPDNGRVSLFTTPSEGLNSLYSSLAERKVGVLPLPYRSVETVESTYSPTNREFWNFGFLGDGRYEKGLLLLLDAILNSRDRINKYMIQDIFPRGYSDDKFEMYQKLKNELLKWENLEFIEKPLKPDDYSKIFDSVDVLLLPYNPLSYDKRVSGIFVEAILRKKPVVTSKITWMGRETEAYQIGQTFNNSRDNNKQVIKDFLHAKNRLMNNMHLHFEKLEFASREYKKYHSAQGFVDSLVRQV